jgi:gamma-glutamyltranspeptidase/glutathione hydrolase
MRAGVSCAHPDAAKIGAQILAEGGNAVDAAIAVQWALAVSYPIAGNIGGGGFMVLRMNNGNFNTLDFREKAPKRARPGMYLDENGAVIENLSQDTHLSVGVPGTVAGLFEAHEKYGRLPMETLIKPAISLARNGFTVQENQARNLNYLKATLTERNHEPIELLQADTIMQGMLIKQNELAETLERIARNGAAEFYSGETAKLFVEEMEKGKGIISMEDLKAYRAIWRPAIVFNYNEYRIISMGPPSSGGQLLAQILTMLDLKHDKLPDHNSGPYIHTLNEIERLAYADRAYHLGDPDFVDIPMEALLSSDYLQARLSLINDSMATRSEDIAAGVFEPLESEETTHLSVVDEEGNAVSVTTTLNGAYGSKLMVSGAGFFMNNEMDDFSVKPGFPNMYGLIGSEANSIQSEKRMLSSMSPSIVEKDDQLFLVVGSPGGPTIPTSTLQVILNTASFGMSLDSALNQPRFHHQWIPDELVLEEGGFSDSLVESLQEMGHRIETRQKIGLVDAIMVQNEEGELEVCGDPRSDNFAAGYR